MLTKDPITVEVPVIEDQYADFYYEHFGSTNEDRTLSGISYPSPITRCRGGTS